MLTQEEYDELINSIPNDEVPDVLFSALRNIYRYLESIAGSMSEDYQYKYFMFRTFYKQYNTIITLSKRTEYITDPQWDYIDIRSINIIIRSMHEMYLVYTYLCSSTFFVDVDKEEELKFKSLAYQYAGANDNARTFYLMKSTEHQGHYSKLKEENALKKKEDIWSQLEHNPIYQTLTKYVRSQLKKGNWKVSNNKILSWADLAKHSHLSRTYGVFEYHNLSLYAHSTFSSLTLEANHDENVDGLLCHCYVLASVFSMSVLDSFDTKIDDEGVFSKRELALILEFYNIASR